MKSVLGVLLAPVLFAFLLSGCQKEAPKDEYVIGVSVGLSGYMANADRSWLDGVLLATRHVNQEGGVLEKPIRVVVEDNRSEPQDAIAAYRRMILRDGVQAFASGCLSSGTFASATLAVRRQIPMVVCSLLPSQPDAIRWTYTVYPPPRFEVGIRLEYLRDQTNIRKVGILYDQSPYANLTAELARELAPEYGIEVVGMEKYAQTDSDFTIALKKLKSMGAGAVLKMGAGPSTLTAARSANELGGGLPLLGSTDNYAMFPPVAKVMGKDFLFTANIVQVYDALPADHPFRVRLGKFMTAWRAVHGMRDPTQAAMGYDAIMLLAEAARRAGSTDGNSVRESLDRLGRHAGVNATYDFSQDHWGVTENPMRLASIHDQRLVIIR